MGNYPGVTVEKVSGDLKLSNQTVECVDVPGLYSLNAISEDEKVASDAIFGKVDRRPDLLLCVLSSGNLERNLFFFSQLAEADFPIVVALTLTDLMTQKGFEIDTQMMSNLLGVEVIPVVAHKGKGLKELRDAIERNLAEPRRASPEFGFPISLETKVATIRERLARAGMDWSRAEVRKALLAEDSELLRDVQEIPELLEAVSTARKELSDEGLLNPSLEVTNRYQWAAMVTKATIKAPDMTRRRKSRVEQLDLFLTHRCWGLLTFAAVMYLVFQSIYTFAKPIMDVIQSGVDWLGQVVGSHLQSQPVLQSLFVKGIIGGVGAVLVFLPQILILFCFIAILEGSGYLARAAFLMDRLLGWCGLNGRAFIPLLSSYACAIPGIMAARVMPDAKSRLATILVAPLMSCSARLPVYLLLIGAFIQPRFGAAWAGFTLFAMHFLGLLVAIPIVFVLNKGVIKGKRLPFLLELPPYQLPKWRDVWLAMYFRARIFLHTAGTIIFFMSVLIWALSYFPRSNEAAARYKVDYAKTHVTQDKDDLDKYVAQRQLADSALGRFGKTIEPVFIPAGFDWRITTSILAAFPARETVVPSMGIIFNLGEGQEESSQRLQKAMAEATWPDGRPLFTQWTAVGLMVFFALCAQCMATLATVRRETNSWKWPVFMFSYMTALAYVAAVGIHQLSRLF